MEFRVNPSTEEDGMFKQRFLTMRVAPAERGLHLFPNFDCVDDETCVATDGCGYCSGDCSDCTATCEGENSIGGWFANREGEVEMVMNLEALREVVRKAERWEKERG
jgi:hypothetical protein